MKKSIYVDNLYIPYTEKYLNIEFVRGFNYIQGNNGSGKTILLDYLAGIRRDREKCIKGNESTIYINQNIFFSDRLTGKDFLEFVYKLDGMKKVERKKRETLFKQNYSDNGHIDDLLKKQWGMLSSGEKKYLYFMILLSIEREWYILDEPFAFVDNEKKEIMWKVICNKIEQGKGVILTSHENDDNLKNNNANVVVMK